MTDCVVFMRSRRVAGLPRDEDDVVFAGYQRALRTAAWECSEGGDATPTPTCIEARMRELRRFVHSPARLAGKLHLCHQSLTIDALTMSYNSTAVATKPAICNHNQLEG